MLDPVVLENPVVRLEPLHPDHESELAHAVADGELWSLWYTAVPPPAAIPNYIQTALHAQRAGNELPFAIRSRASGKIVGSTRYMHIVPEHKRLEIGTTWLSKSVQGTAVNPSAKFLLLEHAFEALGYNRVEFLTHSKNAQSRAALTKLGATQEGILRHHRVLPDGSLRDSVVFSILATEWPSVRRPLEARIACRVATPADIPAMHAVRMSVRENVLSDPRKVQPTDYHAFIHADGGTWVCERQGQIVAFAAANADTGNIWALFVHPDHERRGFGRVLHDAMLTWLRVRGQTTAWLTTEANSRAEHFYRAAGWSVVRVEPNGEIRFERALHA
jgi:N-acetyltransferase